MENQELKILVDELIGYGKELEWLEFKQGNATDNQRLGKYISGQMRFCVKRIFLVGFNDKIWHTFGF